MSNRGRVTLLLAFHNHQPDGNFDTVFQQAYDDCYVRIVDALEEAPHVRVALHHTGALLEWLLKNRPDYIARTRRLVERGQVELLGGGFYEPMLAVLPERDAKGQIEMMRRWCGEHLGQRPDGMWLAERVWEPALPALLNEAGVRFTLIDDNHFRSAGIEGPLRGYYATEKAGRAIAIFPIEQKLRYSIPFARPEEAINALYQLRDETPEGRECVVTYGDDGEKFGLWPGTKEWVWDKGWLREFFRLLGEHRETIRTASFADALRETPPTGRVYLPTASYEEMGEWALPASAQKRYHDIRHRLEERHELEEARPYVRGGIWQGFLAKYDESNAMHKKMVRVSDKVALAVEKHPERQSENALMHDELYRAQCNCSYWHGLFGGLYLNYLRDTVYRHLLVAEAFADAQLGRPAPSWAPNVDGKLADTVGVEEVDVDGDLEAELVIESPTLSATVRPHGGGVVQELAYRPKTFMLTNVLGRHEEGYHEKLREFARKQAEGGGAGGGDQPKSIHDLVQVKEPGLEKHLVYDRWARHCFVDHFLDGSATLDAFARGDAKERGDFVGARWRVAEKVAGGVALERTGTVDGRRVKARKTITQPTGSVPKLVVSYELSVEDGAPLDVTFAPELSLTLLDGNSQERTYQLPHHDLPESERVLTSRGVWDATPSVALVNRANGFRIDVSFGGGRPAVWRFPLETVSMSEAGFEKTYQGSVVLPLFKARLGGEKARFTVEVALSDL